MKRMVIDLKRVGTLKGWNPPKISDDLHQKIMRHRDEYPDPPISQLSNETGLSGEGQGLRVTDRNT